MSTNLLQQESATDHQISLAVEPGSGSIAKQDSRLLEGFADLSSDGFWEMDATLRYSYVSGRFSEITGLPAEFVRGKANEELGLVVARENGATNNTDFMADRNSFRNVVFSCTNDDGRNILVSMNGDAIFDASGIFSGYRGSAIQVDQQLDFANADYLPKATFQLAGRVATLGYWEWDEIADKCALCTEQLAKIHGVSVAEFLRRTTSSAADRLWMHPDDRARYEDAAKKFRTTHTGFEIEYRLLRDDGGIVDVWEVIAPVVNSRGVLTHSFGFLKDISQPTRAAAELQRITDLFRQTEKLAMVGHWEWDEIADRAVFCSEEMAALHGMSVDEYLVTSTTFDADAALVHPADRARYIAMNYAYVRCPVKTEIEYRLVPKGGGLRHIREVYFPEFDENGVHVRSFGSVQDISESKRAAVRLETARDDLEARVIQRTEELQRSNDELRESRARLLDATRIAKLGYFKWDTVANRGIYADEEFAKILGVPVRECMTESLDAYMARIHGNDIEIVLASYAASNNDKIPIDVEYRIVQSNGDIRHVHEQSRQKVDRFGRVVQTFGTLQDITERKVASEELAEVEERLHELGANAREVFYVLSADWQQVIYVNDAYEEIWGYDRQAVIDTPGLWIDSLHADDRDTIVAEIHEKLDGNDLSPNFSDCRIFGPDGEIRWLSNRLYPIQDDAGVVVRYAGVAEDITDRKAATDALHQVQKMDAVGQLTGGVAHDFNNLLAVILGNSVLLQGRMTSEDDLLLQDIITAGNRAAELTKRLLAFSRLQPLQPTATDVVKLVSGMGELLQRTLGATISVEMSSSYGAAVASVDPGLLENAILNLSLNARDAMPDGGRLAIRVEGCGALGSGSSAQPKAPENHDLEIIVQDNGVGMDAEVLARSLEPFFTTKISGEGAGLGLSMVYGFAKQSNGDLVIDSSPGEGTTVTICLPCINAESV